MFNFGISSGWTAVASYTRILNTRAVLMHGTEKLLLSPGARVGTDPAVFTPHVTTRTDISKTFICY